jgi:NAD-dependent DNA ligase
VSVKMASLVALQRPIPHRKIQQNSPLEMKQTLTSTPSSTVSSHNGVITIPISSLFRGHQFIVTGLLEKHKKKIVTFLETNGGQVLGDFPQDLSTVKNIIVVGSASGIS